MYPPQGIKQQALVNPGKESSFPIRLRHVLLVLGLFACYALVKPRLVATFEVHDKGNQLANYAVCMAGPTGLELVLHDSAEFQRLVRRKLLSSRAQSRPFERCAPAAFELSGSVDVQRWHSAEAFQFTEFGGVAADKAAAGSTSQLSIRHLQRGFVNLPELADEAWPLVRGDLSKVVVASMHAPESPHPTAPPQPAIGSGLPPIVGSYRNSRGSGGRWFTSYGRGSKLQNFSSSDGGLNWQMVSSEEAGAERFAGRCGNGDKPTYFRFGMDDTATAWIVDSYSGSEVEHTARLDVASVEILAVACDQDALVSLVRDRRNSRLELRLCLYGGACRPIAGPVEEGIEHLSGELDLARISGTTVLSSTRYGVVRVSSSRDNGTTWTPYHVAYDAAEHSGSTELHARGANTPSRLLALGKQLLLVGGRSSTASGYPVLISLALT